jgi:lysophospholipase L1-like esterase
VGTSKFLGFQLNQGAGLLPASAAERHLEVIGDSITAGYGNEGASNKEHFSPGTENAYWTYGAVTARAFGADYVCIAWSGRCLWPYNTIPSIYDRTLPLEADSTWNFTGPKPQVVLIDLGSNDFAHGAPEEEGWVKAYHEFIAHIRTNYPDTVVYLAIGPMVSDSWPAPKTLTTVRGYIQRVIQESNASGDAKIHYLEFAPQDGSTGYGADWHPSLKTHQRMAQTFIEAIQKDLGWQPVAQ